MSSLLVLWIWGITIFTLQAYSVSVGPQYLSFEVKDNVNRFQYNQYTALETISCYKYVYSWVTMYRNGEFNYNLQYNQ